MENKTTRFYLDPDFRKWPNTSKPYCCRCQKPINLAKQKAIKVGVEWEGERNGQTQTIWECWKDENGEYLLGPDCAKVIGMK